MRFPIHPVMCFVVTCLGPVLFSSTTASAQITGPVRQVTTIAPQDRFDTLEDQLINRLRATSIEQRAYIKFVVQRVRAGQLEIQLIVALERYTRRRRSDLPFPFFERALKFEASRRGVALPSVQNFRTTTIAR